MIAIFDEDGGGDVDFQEFVQGLSAFSSKGDKEQKLKFAFKVYDIDRDGYISNGELFIVLKMMVGSNLKDQQLQQIVDKTIMEADLDQDGKISFEEFVKMVGNTDVSMSMTLGESLDVWGLPADCWWFERQRAVLFAICCIILTRISQINFDWSNVTYEKTMYDESASATLFICCAMMDVSHGMIPQHHDHYFLDSRQAGRVIETALVGYQQCNFKGIDIGFAALLWFLHSYGFIHR